jgi:hypothetical protein
VQQKNFTDFHGYLAMAWQSQISVNRIQRTFAGFLEKQEAGMDEIRQAGIIFDQKPQLNSEGVLVVAGHCQAKPYNIVFSLQYIYELPKWRLFGININYLQ